MLSKVKNKEIKILAIVGLATAFITTGLFGFSFLAGLVLGELLVEVYF